jgi:hypothetical protein
MEEARNDSCRVKLHISQYARHLHGVREIGLSGKTHLPLMNRGRKDICLLYQLLLGRRKIGLGFVQYISNTQHGL